MRLYGLKNCDTCRKAAKVLGIDVTDIRANPLERKDLERFHTAFGDALLNTRSTTWRSLGEVERSGDAFDLILAHPALMKRPVIEAEGKLYLGWKADTQAALGV
ncbi:MAG: ArsC/Spx/MgsR family protein [Pseudomonadota bacterium]